MSTKISSQKHADAAPVPDRLAACTPSLAIAVPAPDRLAAYTPSLAIAAPAPDRLAAYTPSLAIAAPAPDRLAAYTPSLAIAAPAPDRLAAYTPSLAIKLAVLYQGQGDVLPFQQLAERLHVPLYQSLSADSPEDFFLSWQDGCLKLFDTVGATGRSPLQKRGLVVDIEPRNGEQRSWPAPKDGALAQALGRKTRTVIDATTGWAQDSLHIFRMGYELLCIERSPVMAELLTDGFARLAQLDWMLRLHLEPPGLLQGNAIELLAELESAPDCIYLDPMFPPKRKKSALSKKSMMVLRDLLGDDQDKEQLFEAALKAAGKRVVVKSPDYAEPLGGKPSQSFQGKLLRYDVYLKG